MKKSILALASLGALAGIANAQTNVTVYGRLDVSMDRIESGVQPASVQMTDNASRLGFKGTEDLGGTLKAFFGLEFGISADTGGFASATNQFRNSYVGLAGDFGAVAMGRLDSANPTGSPLYSQVTRNIDFAIHDTGAPAIGTKVLNARNRVSNAIGYMSPTFGGFNMRARYYQSGPETPTGTGTGVITEMDFKQTDLGFNYEQGPFAVGIGFGRDTKRGGYLANDFKNKSQIVGSYDFGILKAYGFYGLDKYNNTATTRDSVKSWLVGASAPLGGAHRIIGNYMQRNVQADPNGSLKKAELAYSYQLSKRTQLYALYDREDPNSNVSNDEIKTISVGIQHNF
ncbi:MAG: putative Porin [Herminiimonas sp.]|nr:putative Porin [Herminiimonas sp.]